MDQEEVENSAELNIGGYVLHVTGKCVNARILY